MKHPHIRHQLSVADPLQTERLLRALRIILGTRRIEMQVAIYARVSTLNQQQEGTIASQIQLLKQHTQQRNWNLLPEHEFFDEGIFYVELTLF